MFEEETRLLKSNDFQADVLGWNKTDSVLEMPVSLYRILREPMVALRGLNNCSYMRLILLNINMLQNS